MAIKSKKQSIYLKGTLGFLTIAGILWGIFFLSNANVLTGNIFGLTENHSNWLGLVLLFVGLVSGFFWIKLRKK